MKLNKLHKSLLIIGSVLVAVVLAGVAIGCAFTNPVAKASKKLTNYTISASLSEDYILSGTETVDYINDTGTNLNQICLHLYPRAFREDATIKPYTSLNEASCFPNGISYGTLTVSTVEVNGQSANFIYAGEDTDILQINLPSSLKDGKRITLDIIFEVILPESTHRLGYYKGTINLGNWYPIVCAFSGGKFDTSPYYSTGDPFFSTCSNYKVTINYSSNFDCYATGNKISQSSNSSAQNTASFSAKAVRDFAIVLSSNAEAKTIKASDVSVTYVGYQGDANLSQCTKTAAAAVEYFSNLFGNYPYDGLIVIKSAFLHGGMEYPNIVIIADSIDDEEEISKVIVHEIAHQWWYGLVGNNQVADAWLDESLAEYSTCLFFEDNPSYGIDYDDLIGDAIGGYLIYVDIISSLSGVVNTAMNLPVSEYLNEYEYTYMVYVKGIIMFDCLRQAVGKNKLIKGLKNYCSKYMFKVATATDFIDILKKYCHKDLDNFFDGWLNGSSVVGQI